MIENWQYRTGTDPNLLAPDRYLLDIALMSRPGAEEIQLNLILDYRSNLQRYPEFQAYFRKHQPPLLAVLGGVTIRHSSLQVRRLIGAIFPMPRFICLIQVISLLKHMTVTLLDLSAVSLVGIFSCTGRLARH